MHNKKTTLNTIEAGTSAVHIDSHIHLWDLSIYKRRDWLQDKPQLIRDFSPEDAAQEFDKCGITHGIIVEAVKYSRLDNIEWLRSAQASPRLLGTVTGCYLEDPELPDLLDEYSQWESFLGVRAQPSRESNSWDTLSNIQAGLKALAERGITFEILATPKDLMQTAEIASRFPNLRIVVDHCGLPTVDSVRSGIWAAGIAHIALHPHVFMKYSGLAMIAKGRDEEFFREIADTLLQAFGPSRLIWGSNWPVDSLWTAYEAEWELSRELLTNQLTQAELRRIFATNALQAYGIETETKGE